jgi:hypothetical protein
VPGRMRFGRTEIKFFSMGNDRSGTPSPPVFYRE